MSVVPVSAGARQARAIPLTVLSSSVACGVVAASPVGARGTILAEATVATTEAGPVPWSLIAETR